MNKEEIIAEIKTLSPKEFKELLEYLKSIDTRKKDDCGLVRDRAFMGELNAF
jgi:hypothetical protein